MSEGVLYITDSRTSQRYEIPIHRNTVQASSFQAIKAPEAGTNRADQVANGLRLYDPGLKNTAISESKLTFLDGSMGIIQFRGHNIADFWETADFEDTTHLLIWERWPNTAEKEALRKDLIRAAQNVPDSVVRVVQAFPRTAPPMQMVIAGLAAYLGENPGSIPANACRNLYHANMPTVDKVIIKTVAAFQVCVGLAACHRAGIPSRPVDTDSSYLYNMFFVTGNVDKSTGKPDPTSVYHLQRLWALGADLGHTNSTAAFLLGASTLADPLSCLISALSSGYGIMHFGAAEASLKSLVAIGGKENVPNLIEKVKRREAKLFGYGHRVFKTIDPRILFAAQIMNELGSDHPLLQVAMEIDRIASEDEYFVSRKLEANSDLYIGVVYTALGFEPSIVPVMIMLMRSGGLMAHWREAMGQPTNIWRPQQFYTGEVSGSPADSYGAVASEWKTARAVGNLNNLRTASTSQDAETSTSVDALRGSLKAGKDAQTAKTNVTESEPSIGAPAVPKPEPEEGEPSIWHSTLSEIKDLTRLMSLL
ncbi:hypothetical protein MMC17_008668 [Xylographa soralifera]|nr:hypothetical protein [Xylographa soralifera]